MKIIDKTPLLNEKGELGLTQRLQAMFQYGFNWLNELQAQQAIINYLDKQLDKGYTLIRNYTLGKSSITIPIILLGPTGIHAIHVAYLRGRFEAKGEAWNIEAGESYKPAPSNLVKQTQRMAKALRVFIERQGTDVPVDIEPVLIAGNPGMHIESVRPVVRVLMIDGVRSFVSNLAGGQPVLTAEKVFELTDRILNPHLPRKASRAVTRVAEPPPDGEQTPQEVSRARAIFDASQDLKPFDPADFDFAMEDDISFDLDPSRVSVVDTAQAEAAPPSRPPRRRILGMTPVQLAVLLALVLALVCIVAGFAYYVLFLA
jgi:hypothetical protein